MIRQALAINQVGLVEVVKFKFRRTAHACGDRVEFEMQLLPIDRKKPTRRWATAALTGPVFVRSTYLDLIIGSGKNIDPKTLIKKALIQKDFGTEEKPKKVYVRACGRAAF